MIKGQPGENAAVVIYDAFGRVVQKMSEMPLNKKLTIGLNLPSAVYYVHVTREDEGWVLKNRKNRFVGKTAFRISKPAHPAGFVYFTG
jgi:hypothetical protein